MRILSPLEVESWGCFPPASGLRFLLLRLGLLQSPFYELAEEKGCRDAFLRCSRFQLFFKSFGDGYARPLFAHVFGLSFLHAYQNIRFAWLTIKDIFVHCNLFSLTINQVERIVCVLTY